MEFYPEIFFSIWHLLVIFIVIVTFIGLMIGGYSKQTKNRLTLKALLVSYIAVTAVVYLFTYENVQMKHKMIGWMDDSHEDDEELAAYVGSFGEEDGGDMTVKVYVGNYHDSKPFQGSITILTTDENDETLKTETYQDVQLDAGGKEEIDSYEVVSDEQPERFNYLFMEDEED